MTNSKFLEVQIAHKFPIFLQVKTIMFFLFILLIVLNIIVIWEKNLRKQRIGIGEDIRQI